MFLRVGNRRLSKTPLGLCLRSSAPPPFSSPLSHRKRKTSTQSVLVFLGASGDTELFEKASNINSFQGGRVANNLYIFPFRATVFQTAALFLYPNSSAVIGVENLRFLSLWLAF